MPCLLCSVKGKAGGKKKKKKKEHRSLLRICGEKNKEAGSCSGGNVGTT